MNTNKPSPPPGDAPLSNLEQSLIRDFLRRRGHDHDSLLALPNAERDALLKEASLYASGKLSEVESRSRFVHELHVAISDVAKAGKA